MEKADIQKSLIIFNCFVLSWSDVRVTHGSYMVLFQRKSSSSLYKLSCANTTGPWTLACPCSPGFLAQHLERGLVLKMERLCGAIKGLFQPSEGMLEKLKYRES